MSSSSTLAGVGGLAAGFLGAVFSFFRGSSWSETGSCFGFFGLGDLAGFLRCLLVGGSSSDAPASSSSSSFTVLFLVVLVGLGEATSSFGCSVASSVSSCFAAAFLSDGPSSTFSSSFFGFLGSGFGFVANESFDC